MEVYFKDLISEEASLEELVDHLMLVVQGTEQLAAATGARVAPERQEEIARRLQWLKERCRRLKAQAVSGAMATDRALHRYPYWVAGVAFGLGFASALLVCRVRAGQEPKE